MFVHALQPNSDGFLVCFSMVVTRGSGSSDPERSCTSDDEIRRIVAIELAAEIRGAIPEMIGSINTTSIETFDECYVVVTEDAAFAATTVVVVVTLQGVIRYGIGSSTT